MSQVAIDAFTLTLSSNDLSVVPSPLDPANTSRHVAFRTDIQPMLRIQENERWQIALANIEFKYTGVVGAGVFVNVSLVEGTRIGSTRAQFLYRIPGPALHPDSHTALHPHVFYLPEEHPALFTDAVSEAGTRRVVEVALTDENGTVLPAPSDNSVPTTITLSFQRVA